MFLEYVSAIAIYVIAFLLVFVLIDRVCKCIERCCTTKAYSDFLKQRKHIDIDKLSEEFTAQMKGTLTDEKETFDKK